MTPLPQLDWWVGPLLGFAVAVFSARHLMVRSSNRGLQVTARARAREQIYQIAARAFGFPSYQPAPEADREERRQLRDLRTEHKRQTVELGWDRGEGLRTFTVTHPVDVDTRPGAPARTEFEAMIRANLMCPPEHRWTFAWPDGAQRVECHLEPAVAGDLRRVYDVLAGLLGYEGHVDITVVLDVERDPAGGIARIDAQLPTSFGVSQVDRRLAVQRDVTLRLRSPRGAWRHTWHPHDDRYRISAVPDLPTRAPLPVERLRDWDAGDCIPFAVTHDDQIVSWDTTDVRAAHMLLAGATGAGKTTTGRAIVLAAILLGWDVRVCDPKRDEDWAWLAAWPGGTVATTLEQMHRVITDTHDLMEQRSTQRWEAATSQRPAPALRPVLLYVDELADLFVGSRNTASQLARAADELRGDCRYLFGRIAAKGRAPRVHLVGATQRPSAKVLDADAKFNLQMRVGLGDLDPDAARIVFTNTRSGDDRDLDDVASATVPGRGLVTSGADLLDAQMFWIGLDEARNTLPAAVEVIRVERARPALPAAAAGEGERQRAGGRGSAGEGERQRAGGRGSAGEGERPRTDRPW
jgi:hypothetical protein